jgi:hypothetical protein
MKTFTGIWTLTAGIIFLCLCTVNKAMAQVASGKTGDNCTWIINGTSGNYTLTVSGNGAMADYTGNDTGNDTGNNLAPWYASFRDNIKTVIIEAGVTTVGNYAFDGCRGLTSITISSSVVTVGDFAFFDCTGLTSVTIPNSVVTVGNGAFANCSSLKKVTIPQSVKTVRDIAFTDCESLTSIDVDANNTSYSSVNGVLFNKSQRTLIQYPAGKTGHYTISNSITAIKDYAFYGCSGLTSVTISNSVKTIGAYAFSGCSSLTSVSIGNLVTAIGDGAFSHCGSLTSVTVPRLVKTVGYGAFDDCKSLTGIDVIAGNASYASVDGVLLDKSKKTFIQCPGGKAGSYTLPHSAEAIGAFAFYLCSNLTEVTVGNSVTAVGDYAFRGCSRLNRLNMKAQTPPALDGGFVFQHMSANTLHVPCKAENTYRNAEKWKDISWQNILGDILPNLTVESNNPALGTVEITDIDCTNNRATIQAVAVNTGYRFIQWNDHSTNNPRTVTVTGNSTFTARFEANIYHVMVGMNKSNTGTVTGTGDYLYNTNVSIKATANTGYRFVKWDDGNTTNPRTVTVKQDTAFTAVFDKENQGDNGITETAGAAVIIYPNPVRDILFIRSDAAIEQVIVHDISGKIRKETTAPGQEVSVRDLSDGLYFVRIKTTSGATVRKIVVSK